MPEPYRGPQEPFLPGGLSTTRHDREDLREPSTSLALYHTRVCHSDYRQDCLVNWILICDALSVLSVHPYCSFLITYYVRLQCLCWFDEGNCRDRSKNQGDFLA